MTLLFFLLFYTAPAGMVLYWTSTNAVQLVIQELRRLRVGADPGSGGRVERDQHAVSQGIRLSAPSNGAPG